MSRLVVVLLCMFVSCVRSVAQCTHTNILTQGFTDWTKYDVEGEDSWFVFESSANINGFGGDGSEEDWLISPSIDLTTTTNPTFSFSFSDRYSGPDLELYYSADYSGTGNPTTATWVLLSTLPDMSDSNMFSSSINRQVKLPTDNISISVAFKYTASGTGPGEAEHWQIDNPCVSEGTVSTIYVPSCEAQTADYYACVKGKIDNISLECVNLKSELHEIINNNTYIPYTSSSYDVWDFVCDNDVASNKVIDRYSNQTYSCSNDRDRGGSKSREGLAYNREHVFPKSWQGSDDVLDSDLHNILPSDAYVNSLKSNFRLGDVGAAAYTSTNGSKIGSPSLSDGCGGSTNVFEPADEYKGDFARIYFYVITRYQDKIVSWENNVVPQSDDALSGEAFTGLEPCLMTLLLQWHKNDTVSQLELDRNEAIFELQGNRNPFVDHPEYASAIWEVSCRSNLPVDLANIEVTKSQNGNALTWTTLNEINNDYFTVEYSTDGINFVDLANVTGAGNSTDVKDYVYTHTTPSIGTNYYRLKQVDFDGVFEYSDIVYISNAGDQAYMVYPNPATDEVQIYTSFNTKSNHNEVTVRNTDLKIVATSNALSVDLTEVPTGVYFIEIKQNGRRVHAQKLIKQ